MALLEGNLASVDALKEVKEDLKRRKDVSESFLIHPCCRADCFEFNFSERAFIAGASPIISTITDVAL